MDTRLLTEHILLNHTPEHVHLKFDSPYQVISSAVLNGGIVEASHIVNMKVTGDSRKSSRQSTPPEMTLSEYCRVSNWHGIVVGMMTAASMDSLRIAKRTKQGVEIVVLVTAGLSNPRRAGDHAEHRTMGSHSQEFGTINIIALTSATLTQAALVEALMIATEAKAASLQTLEIRSAVSPGIATGTGTDAIAIASGHDGPVIRYCGKHVLFGEILAKLVMEAVTSSVKWGLGRDGTGPIRRG